MTTRLVRIYSYSRCSTCRKAINWLDSNNIPYEVLDIIENPPDNLLLNKALNYLGDRKYLFNTSGASYRAIGSSAVKAMSDDQALEALVKDGKLIKRPFLVTPDEKILVGFKPEVWANLLLK